MLQEHADLYRLLIAVLHRRVLSTPGTNAATWANFSVPDVKGAQWTVRSVVERLRLDMDTRELPGLRLLESALFWARDRTEYGWDAMITDSRRFREWLESVTPLGSHKETARG